MFEDVISFIRDIYKTNDFIPLHEPKFIGNEKKYLNECIDSTFVSSVGKFVNIFEEQIASYTGAKYAVATVNGTAALHISLLLAAVGNDDEVLTQPLSFVATCNAIRYCGAHPIFIDVDIDTLGMSPKSLECFLRKNTIIKNNKCINKLSGKVIKACLPMHTFGNPCRIDEIKSICDDFKIVLIEDAAESLGSYYKDRHTGTFGAIGTISFNGNKIITSGGGGCIITNDDILAIKAKHLTTTAKIPHKWDFYHDQLGYNYRMPNINAAILVAQLEQLDSILVSKRKIAQEYKNFFKNKSIKYIDVIKDTKSNHWLNSILTNSFNERELFLQETNNAKIMTRPIWRLMNKLPMFKDCQKTDLNTAEWLENRIVNIPSSAII